ncbi:MAG: GNAT family N-acetyltransferase [Planctomycetota bacterium]
MSDGDPSSEPTAQAPTQPSIGPPIGTPPDDIGPVPRREDIRVRRYLVDDPIPAITSLLHRAYARQRAMGLDPLAGRQDDRTTLERVLASECYLAVDAPPNQPERRIVGLILFNEHEKVSFPATFLQPGTAHFAMFAVDPTLQGIGIGVRLLETVEARAREIASDRLALSMAEPDTALQRYYERRGYAFVETWRWPYTNYDSLILARPIE